MADKDREVIKKVDELWDEGVTSEEILERLGATPEPPEPPDPDEPETKQVTVGSDKAKYNLQFAPTKNPAGRPIFAIYPGDSSAVKDRVQVKAGQVLTVYVEIVKGDGGEKAYELGESMYPMKDNSGRPVFTPLYVRDVDLK